MMERVCPRQQEIQGKLLQVWENDYLDQVQPFQALAQGIRSYR